MFGLGRFIFWRSGWSILGVLRVFVLGNSVKKEGIGGLFKRAFSGQAYKGARRMPRHGQAMKGVVSCEKHRGAARRL